MLLLTPTIAGISNKRCQWLPLRVWWHALALVTYEISWHRAYVIQIKICAEYRDMLPRPRLVCQEPGLSPIGRSPGVPDKSSRGLGSMSWYSAFSFFYFSVGLVGNLSGLPSCTVPSAIVHCNQNEADHQTIKAPSMPCWGAGGLWKHSGIYSVNNCVSRIDYSVPIPRKGHLQPWCPA